METKISDVKKADIKKIVAVLNAGGAIIFPTETVYGLGGDATNAQAILKIFRIKGRVFGKAFPLLVKDWKMLLQYAIVNEDQKKTILAVKQPTSFVLKAKNLSPLVMQQHTAAFRISPYPWVKKLFRYFDRPLVATSANLAGQPPLSDPEQYRKVFGRNADLIDAVISEGANRRQKPSRIMDLTSRPYRILRR